MHQLFSLHFQKDNILILCGVRHYPVNFVIDLQENIKFHDIQFIWNELFMLKMLAVETSAEFLKNLSIPISSSTSFRWAAQSATSQRFAEWSNLRFEENPQICGRFDIFTQLNAHFGSSWTNSIKIFAIYNGLKWIMVGLLCNMLWSKCLYFLCERRDMKKSVHCYPFS